MLYQLVRAMARKYEVVIPNNLEISETGAAKPLSLENELVQMTVDYTMPTEQVIKERKPDLILYVKNQKRVEIFEVAVSWDEIVEKKRETKV